MTRLRQAANVGKLSIGIGDLTAKTTPGGALRQALWLCVYRSVNLLFLLTGQLSGHVVGIRA